MISDEKTLISLKQQMFRLLIILLWIILGIIIFKLAQQVQEIVFCFLIAVLINYLLAKPVNFLARFIKSRMAAVLLIFVTVVSTLMIVIYVAYPNIVSQVLIFRNTLPNLTSELYQVLIDINLFLVKNYQIELPINDFNEEEILNYLITFVTKINVSDFGSTVATVVTGSVNIILYIVLSLIMSFYMLVDGERAWHLFLVPFSDKIVKHLTTIRARINVSLNAFILGQVQIATLTSLVMLATYLILLVPFGGLLAVVQMLEIFPVLGTWVAIVPCIIIVCLTSGVSKGVIAFIVYILYTQFVRDNFIAPKIMGSALGLHPLGIIVAIIIGAKMGGLIGIVFALPILATINAIVDYNVELSRLKVSKTHDWEGI